MLRMGLIYVGTFDSWSLNFLPLKDVLRVGEADSMDGRMSMKGG